MTVGILGFEAKNVISKSGRQFFYTQVAEYYQLIPSEEKITMLRDPLFVISASVQIMKQHKSETQIESEIKRIQSALDKIGKIMQV